MGKLSALHLKVATALSPLPSLGAPVRLMVFLGCLIEMACLILMLTPVILPIWMSLGLSPIHLGVVKERFGSV